MIAFHYPPLAGSSGLQRTLSFANYLAEEHGWRPIVLSAHPRAYSQTSGKQLADIHPGVTVLRAQAWDTSRHLAVRGRYPGCLALPDPWISWWPHAVYLGLKSIRLFGVSAIWSTYPIATAHLIARTLAAKTRLPWIADFRDSMTEDNYPADPAKYRAYRRIERGTVELSRACVFTTPGARTMYEHRYADVRKGRFHLIENGYDEAAFAGLELPTRKNNPTKLRILHSGLLYRSERDPEALFGAVRQLKDSAEATAENLEITLRASGDERYFRERIEAFGIDDIVRLAPPISYREALKEMLEADVLLVLQASNCNHQIPAKVYEYFRAARPILALTDAAGDTARLVEANPCGQVVPLDVVDEIAGALRNLLTGNAIITSPAGENAAARYSRRSRTAELADLVDAVISL